MKTKLTQRRIKARKASACGLCKPWKQGGADKKTVRDLRLTHRVHILEANGQSYRPQDAKGRLKRK